jgi:hypothetical protein
VAVFPVGCYFRIRRLNKDLVVEYTLSRYRALGVILSNTHGGGGGGERSREGK